MFSTLMMAALLAPNAPVPRDVGATGPAPYILNLKPGNDGETKVTVMRMEKQKVQTFQAIAGPNGQQIVQPMEQEVSVNRYVVVPMSELKDLKVFTANGKEVAIKDAVKKVAEGGMVVASSNGQKVDASYLKLFKDDVLVLVSPDLIPQNRANTGGFRGGWGTTEVMPLPAPLMPAMPVAPPAGPGGAVQIQILPAVAPPAVPVPLPKKDEK